MDLFPSFTGKQKVSPLDRPLPKVKYEVSVNAFAFLFSEVVQYCHSKVYTVPELQKKLSEMGYHVGQRLVDLTFIRDKNYKRETKLINILIFIKTNLWKTLFAKDADKLEHSNDDPTTYYIIESDPIVNKYISYNRDKGSLNCASFIGGIIEAALNETGFNAKVTVHWHKGTTFMIKFDQAVIDRDKAKE